MKVRECAGKCGAQLDPDMGAYCPECQRRGLDPEVAGEGRAKFFTTARVLDATLTKVELLFQWHGGEYIDITRRWPHALDHPSEVINVWDSYHDRPRIERTQEAFEAKVDDWIQAYDEERVGALVHDVLENWS